VQTVVQSFVTTNLSPLPAAERDCVEGVAPEEKEERFHGGAARRLRLARAV
jgi:hypothetical protein